MLFTKATVYFSELSVATTVAMIQQIGSVGKLMFWNATAFSPQ
jgi:hypothetical protein